MDTTTVASSRDQVAASVLRIF